MNAAKRRTVAHAVDEPRLQRVELREAVDVQHVSLIRVARDTAQLQRVAVPAHRHDDQRHAGDPRLDRLGQRVADVQRRHAVRQQDAVVRHLRPVATRRHEHLRAHHLQRAGDVRLATLVDERLDRLRHVVLRHVRVEVEVDGGAVAEREHADARAIGAYLQLARHVRYVVEQHLEATLADAARSVDHEHDVGPAVARCNTEHRNYVCYVCISIRVHSIHHTRYW